MSGVPADFRLRRKDWLFKIARKVAAGALLYHRIEVEGGEHLPRQGAALLLPKHRAYRDLLVEGVILYRIARRLATYVMKPGLFSGFEHIGGFKIVRPKDIRRIKDREARRAEIRRARQANQQTRDYLTWLYGRGELIVSHPEGMRYQEVMGAMQTEIIGHLLQAEQQLKLRIPVIPIGLEYESYARPRARVYMRIGEPLFSDQFGDQRELVDRIDERLRVLSGIARESK